ncbi:MAG: TonB-dependent receptor [Arcobacter sp.]|uniref:TonB-dependent receptor domain-containing protein n=1 Tax=Arcobacter sp. TaxID=1872629 RepID=UPI003D020488
MKHKKILLSSIAAISILVNANANETTQLEEVNVWETQVISSSLNLGENAIESKQADHLGDLLRDLPGVDVGGTHSINNRINIRGLQDENLDITLDGAKIQNANMFHHIGNLLINPDILKKADIQVGTNSVVNGSLGGTVTFETKDGKDMLETGKDFGARISSTYNSNDSLGGSITGYGKVSQNTDFLIYHNYLNKNDWKDGTGLKTFGTDGKVQNTLVKLAHNLSDTQRVSISYDTLTDEGDYSPRPDFGRAYNEARTGLYTYPTEYVRETITLKHELNLGDKLVLNSTVYTNENELERYEKLNGITPVRPGGVTQGLLNGKVKTEGLTSKAQTNFQTGIVNNTLTYGGLYDVQTSKVTWDGAKYGDNEKAKSAALYVEDMIDFDNGLIVTPGIRYNHYDFDGVYGKIKDNKFTYGLASEYAVTNNLTLLASATTLYKGVEMVDVLATNRVYAPNTPDLKAETGINKELGFTYNRDNFLGADTTGFSFKVFNTEIDDYIQTVGYEMTNAGSLNLRGFESSFLYKLDKLSALLTYSHSDTKFEKTGLPDPKEPGDSVSIGLDYKVLSNLSVSWDSLIAFKQDDVAGSEYNVKNSYDVHDIALNWKPQAIRNLTVITGVDNIFDEAYVSHISENRTYIVSGNQISTADYEPGRNFKVTLAYKF